MTASSAGTKPAVVDALKMDQISASRTVLTLSQQATFPYTMHSDALELDVEVHQGVFSPQHFHGWDVFTRHFPPFADECVLEVGCGTGVTAIFLAAHGAKHVLAVDINACAVRNTMANRDRLGLANLHVRQSDVFSGLTPFERFDTIYWNLPFMYVPPDYEYQSELERGLFDPGYRYTERFLAEAPTYLKAGGRLLVGLADFADMPRFHELANRYGYLVRLLAVEASEEINAVEFQLYELKLKS